MGRQAFDADLLGNDGKVGYIKPLKVPNSWIIIHKAYNERKEYAD